MKSPEKFYTHVKMKSFFSAKIILVRGKKVKSSFAWKKKLNVCDSAFDIVCFTWKRKVTPKTRVG